MIQNKFLWRAAHVATTAIWSHFQMISDTKPRLYVWLLWIDCALWRSAKTIDKLVS